MAPRSVRRRLKQLVSHITDANGYRADAHVVHRSALVAASVAMTGGGTDTDDAVAAFHRMSLFDPAWDFTPEMKAQMDTDGHVTLPGLMTAEAVRTATAACVRVQAMHEKFTDRITPLREAHAARVAQATSDAEREALEEERWKPGVDGDFNLVLNPGSNCAEMDPFFEAALGHPSMKRIVDRVLGEDWRFDHCTMVRSTAPCLSFLLQLTLLVALLHLLLRVVLTGKSQGWGWWDRLAFTWWLRPRQLV